MSELSKRIRIRREELGLSQEVLATLIGYKSRSSINKIELGENDIPQAKIKLFADALQTTPAYLMGLTDDKNNFTLSDGLIDDIAFELDISRETIEKIAYSDDISAIGKIIKVADILAERKTPTPVAESELTDLQKQAIQFVLSLSDDQLRQFIRIGKALISEK